MFRNSSRIPQAEIFNTSDFVINNNAYTVQTDFDESQYVRRDGSFITGDLILTGASRIIFENGSEQRFAFDEQNLNAINTSNDKVSAIDFLDGTTTVSGNLTITGNVSIPDNSLTMSKVSGLTGNISSLQSGQSALENSVSINTNDIVDIKAYNTQNTIDITNINNDIIEINTEIDAIKTLNTSQSNTIDTHSTNLSNIQNSITTINASILSHSNNLTTHTNEINIIESNHTNLSGIVSGIQTDLTTAESNISTLQANFTALNDSVPTNENFANLNITVDGLETSVNTINTHLVDLDTKTDIQRTDIDSINTQLTTNTASITAINTELTTVNDTIDNYSNAIITQGNQINFLINQDTNITTQINTKQDIINEFNFLDIAFVGNGTISNEQLETLTGIKTTETIQYQIDAIKSNVSNLTGLQNIDITDIDTLQADNTSNKTRLTSLENTNTTQNTINNTFSSQITSLQTATSSNATSIDDMTISFTTLINTKNNIIDDSNKLSSAFVEYSNGTVEQKLEEYNTMLSSIGNDILGLQDSKQDLITNLNKLPIANVNLGSSSLSFVDITSGLTSQLNALVSTDTSLSNSVNTINTNIGVLTNADVLHDTQIASIQADITGLENSKQDLITNLNKLTISNVDLGLSSLSHIDITSSLTSQLNALVSTDTTFNNSINTINTNLQVLTNADVLHDTQIASIQADITGLENSKQDLIDASNKIVGDFVETGVNQTLTQKLTALDTSISGLNSSKQNVINDTNNKLPINKVDLTGSSLEHIDISAPLQAQLTSINNSISTLTGLQAGDLTTFQDIQDNFDLVDTQLGTKQNIIDVSNRLDASLIGDGSVNNTIWGYLSNIDADIQAQVNNLETGSNAYHSINYNAGVTTIADKTILTTLEFSGDNSQQTIAFSSEKNTELINATANISLNALAITAHSADINNNYLAIQTKQNIINNSTNKLPLDHINLTGSSLVNVDISNPLQAQLDTINSNINSLQNYDTSQTTLNTTLTNSINDLETSKQNIIDDANKVSALYISYNGISTVKDELDGLHSYHTTNDTQLADIESSITSLSSSKQNVIDAGNKLAVSNVDLTGSSLAYVDISNPLQSTINTINNGLTSLNTSIGNLTTIVSGLGDTDDVYSGLIADNTTAINNITTLTSSKQDVIDASNKLSSSVVSYNSSTVDVELGNINTALSSKAPIDNPTFTGIVGGLTKSMVGLSNVDNTADTDKPISTATQSALDLKANLANPTFTGTVGGITKSMVGLSNVDNTTDAAKPVSTATQTALNGKLNLSGGTLTGSLTTNSNIILTGTSKLKYPSGVEGQVLTSDGTGNLILQTPSAGSSSIPYVIGSITDATFPHGIPNGAQIRAVGSFVLDVGVYFISYHFNLKTNSTTAAGINYVSSWVHPDNTSVTTGNIFYKFFIESGVTITSSSSYPVMGTGIINVATAGTYYLKSQIGWGSTTIQGTVTNQTTAPGQHLCAFKLA